MLRGFAMRLAGLLLIAMLPALMGRRPMTASLGYLATYCALGAILNLGRAAGRKQTVGAGPLNHWDEALAFVALSRLVRVMEDAGDYCSFVVAVEHLDCLPHERSPCLHASLATEYGDCSSVFLDTSKS